MTLSEKQNRNGQPFDLDLSLSMARAGIHQMIHSADPMETQVIHFGIQTVEAIRRQEATLTREQEQALGLHMLMICGYTGGLAICDTARVLVNVQAMAGYWLYTGEALPIWQQPMAN